MSPHGGDVGPIDTGPIRNGSIAPTLPWLDWLRFLAAFEVFLFHLRLYIFKPYADFAPAHKNAVVTAWIGITHFGGEAVLVFFALSGYLVGGGLISRVRTGTFRPADYAIDRSTRLLLPFIPAMAAAVALQYGRGEPIDVAVILGNIASLQGVLVPVQPYLGVDWSLAYEFWFYVLGGALAICLAGTRRPLIATAIAAVAFLVFSGLAADLLFCWVLGVLASQITVRRASGVALLGGLMIAGAGLFLSNELFVGARMHLLHVGVVPGPIWHIVLTIGVLILVCNLVAIPHRSALARRVDAVGTKLAAFSYSLYLVHIPILTCLMLLGLPQGQDLTGAALLQYGISIVAVLLGSYGFYWLFERHTDAVRRGIKRRWLKRAANA